MWIVRKLMRFSCVDMTENVAYICVDDEVRFTSPFTPPAHKVLDLGLARVL